MSAASDTLETWIINHFFRNSAQSGPTSIWLGLFSVQPTNAGTGGTEVAGGSYQRQAVTLGASSGGVSSNTNELVYTAMPLVTIVAGALFTAFSGGTMLTVAPFQTPRTTVAGRNFVVPVGDVIVRVR